MAVRVTWPAQVASGALPEEYATESRALVRARELVALGHPHATCYEVDDAEGAA